MNRTVELSKLIYPEACFHEAAVAFQEFGRLSISDNTAESYRLHLEAHSGVDEVKFYHECLNYLLNLSLERHLERL